MISILVSILTEARSWVYRQIANVATAILGLPQQQ